MIDAVRRRDDEATVWLNLPPSSALASANEIACELCGQLGELQLDDEIRVLVLVGNRGNLRTSHDCDKCGRALRELSVPTIASVDGDLFEEDLELALSCDFRIASTQTRLRMAQLDRMSVPAHGGASLLARYCGAAHALDLLLSGRQISAAEANAFGLLSRVVACDQVPYETDRLVSVLREKAPIALQYAKEAIWKGSELTFDQGIRLEQDLYALLQTTKDHAEGIAAFRQKRQPKFRGC